MVKAELHRILEGIVGELGSTVSFEVGYPPHNSSADYATNAALVCAKELKQNPKELAEEIASKLKEAEISFIEAVEVAGPGFINIYLTRAFFSDAVGRAQAEGEDWGANASRDGDRIMVEHSQPNPFKPFHIGHLMSNTIGESIARLMRASGAMVSTVNYQGDVGLHVAKALWGLRKLGGDANNVEKLGEAYVLGNSAYEEDASAKEEIVSINKKVYAKDPEILDAYNKGRKASLDHFEELYRALGSVFERYFFESETAPIGLRVVEEGKEKGVFEESDGAVVFRGESVGLHTRVFVTKEGLPTYETKDLGLAVAKKEYRSFDLSITTTAVEQKEYFKVVFEALARVKPEMRDKYVSITHGMMQLSSGKMSSRKGNVITGESLLSDMTGEALKRMEGRDIADKEGVAQVVGVAAIKYGVLKQSLGKNIVFDPEQSLSFEGDSGPYLQYAHVRTGALLRKGKDEGVEPSADTPTLEASSVEKFLIRFPEIVERAAEEYEPHHIAQYLTELSAEFNSWYAQERILGTEHASYKLAVVDAVRQTLHNGLHLLGIKAPSEM